MIPPDLERWLSSAGYAHYVFVSYARVPEAAATKFALTVAGAVRQRLSDFTAVPACRRVFVDEQCLPKGEPWEPRLQDALFRSVMMVAICAPIYYRAEHRWCGQEYEAMLSLGRHRQVGTVVPLIVRKFQRYPLPQAVAGLQFFDLVDELTRYPNYHRRRPFQQAIDQIIDRLVNVATALRANNAAADALPGGYRFPQISAFDDYDGPVQSAPLRLQE
jgi:hypothetical protein